MSNWKVSFFPAILLALAMFLPAAVSAQQVQVTSAVPSETPQGTISLDVTVNGSGFDSSAQVEFLVTGTSNPGGITVRKVKVTGPKKLIATIDVADTAVIDKFDVQVSLSGGRKGKGTSLFAVLAKGSNDPCAAPGIDFPAFTFRRLNPRGDQIFVADATGQCVRFLFQMGGDIGISWNKPKFSYPVAGTANTGRLIWTDTNNGLIVNEIYVFTFQISGTSITGGTLDMIYESSPMDIGGADLSTDGTTVYFGVDTLELYSTPRIMAIDAVGNNLREVFIGPPDGSDFNQIAANEDGAVFVTKSSGDSGLRQLLRIDASCNNLTCANLLEETPAGSSAPGFPAASHVDDRLAYLQGLLGFTNCWQLMFIPDAGGPIMNSAQPRYGRDPSWYGNQVLVDGHSPPNRKGVCESTGMVTQIDPDTSAEIPLVRGIDADGR